MEKQGRLDKAGKRLGRSGHGKDGLRWRAAIRWPGTQADNVPVSRGGAPIPTERCCSSGVVIDRGPIDLPGRHVVCNALAADSGTIIDVDRIVSVANDATIDGCGSLCVNNGGTLDLTAPDRDGGLTHSESGCRQPVEGQVLARAPDNISSPGDNEGAESGQLLARAPKTSTIGE